MARCIRSRASDKRPGTLQANFSQSFQFRHLLLTSIKRGADGAISANLRRHAEAARGAFAASTKRALRGDIARFTGWCVQEDR